MRPKAQADDFASLFFPPSKNFSLSRELSRILLNLFSAFSSLAKEKRHESLLCALQSMKNQCLYCKLYLNRLNCINVDGFLWRQKENSFFGGKLKNFGNFIFGFVKYLFYNYFEYRFEKFKRK